MIVNALSGKNLRSMATAAGAGLAYGRTTSGRLPCSRGAGKGKFTTLEGAARSLTGSDATDMALGSRNR